MKNNLLFWILLTLAPIGTAFSQCTLLPNAIPGLTLTYVQTNMGNCSGVAYNPGMGLYYAVRAGNPSFPLETWNSIGTPLYQTNAGFDYRGMWWNPALGQMEANGYNTYGIWRSNLNGSGYALNTGATLLAANQPNSQSCGDLDYVNNEIVYYYSGAIYRYDRNTNALVGSVFITGLPVGTGNLNWTTVFYTGCAGMEIGVLDYVTKRVYLINRITGVYAGVCNLPGGAITSNGFRSSWANNLLWLFDIGSRTWFSYTIFDAVLDLQVDAKARWMGKKAKVSWETMGEIQQGRTSLQYAIDGVNFQQVQTDEKTEEGSFFHQPDPNSASHYYRIQLQTTDGKEITSNIVFLTQNNVNGQGASASLTSAELILYPNPASTSIHVLWSDSGEENMQITLTDLQGKVLKKIDQSPAPSGYNQAAQPGSIEIEVDDLAPGIYLCRVRQGNRIGTARFAK